MTDPFDYGSIEKANSFPRMLRDFINAVLDDNAGLRKENERLLKENELLKNKLSWERGFQSEREQNRLDEAARNGDVYL